MKYLMVLQHGAMDEYLYKDILDQQYAREFKVSGPDCRGILYIIRRVHTSTIATKFFDPPLKSIWYQKKLLEEVDNNTCLVFQMAAMIHVGFHTLKAIKQKYPNAKLVLLLVDSINAHSVSMKYAKRFIFGYNWDLILSFDKADCEKYGFKYMGYSYYSKLDTPHKNRVDSDLYYIGALKDEDTRALLLSEIIQDCNSNQVSCDFTLLTQKNQKIHKSIKIIEKGLKYEEVVKSLVNSNCILEIVQPGQNNQTARYMEAVCYNKKLLTNNKNICDLPYYNPRYMKCFTSAEDIDFSWVKERLTIDYNYKNDFSPLRLIDLINEAFD